MSQLLGVLQSLSLSQPMVLWVLVLAVPLVVLAPRARLRLTSLPLRLGVLGIRLVIAGLLVVGLAEPTLRPAGHARAVVFAIDVSDSLSPDQQLWARGWVESATRALPPGSHSDTIEFGQRAQLVGSSELPPGGTTDLGAALRLATTLLPRGENLAPEVVLLTDGWQTAVSPPPSPDALPAGVRVSYVPIPATTAAGRQPGVAVIHSLDVPPIARAGDKVDVTIGLQAVQPVDARLRLSLDQTVVADGTIHLDPGDTRMSLPERIAAPGFVEVRADLLVAGAATPSTLSAVVVAKPAGRVLVLEDEANTADELVAMLQGGGGLQIDRRPSSSLPPSASALSMYDGIVLVNTPATGLSLDQQRTLVSFVQDLGRGLLVVGGARAFAPGGYQGTPLDDLLPVSAEPPIEPQQGSLALFLVIDRSGSMDVVTGGGTSAGGATKMAMAREAAIEAAGLLQPRDTLGVIAFDSGFQWVVPPTQLRTPDDARRAAALISTIKPGGGTSILPPLEAAYQAALDADAPLKHVILLTDGESNDRGFEDLIARMKPAQITLSTLAIGSDADTKLLSNLAHIGGGRYYFTERSTQIPRIASKETTILTRNAVIEGQVAAVVADPSPILRSLSGDLPALSGFVATTRKDRAVTALETEKGLPLLAHWQYGLGRVVAWTSEAQQGWGSAWGLAGCFALLVAGGAVVAAGAGARRLPAVRTAWRGWTPGDAAGPGTQRRCALRRLAGHAGDRRLAGWVGPRSAAAAAWSGHLQPGYQCDRPRDVPRVVRAGHVTGGRGLQRTGCRRAALRGHEPRAPRRTGDHQWRHAIADSAGFLRRRATALAQCHQPVAVAAPAWRWRSSRWTSSCADAMPPPCPAELRMSTVRRCSSGSGSRRPPRSAVESVPPDIASEGRGALLRPRPYGGRADRLDHVILGRLAETRSMSC